MDPRSPQSRIEREMVDRYPDFFDAAVFARSCRALMAGVAPDGRRMLARLLDAAALGLEDRFKSLRTTLIAPQLILWQAVAQDCRDLAAACRRYAGASQGTRRVYLSADARLLLNLYESHDPGRGIDPDLAPSRTVVRLLKGVSVR